MDPEENANTEPEQQAEAELDWEAALDEAAQAEQQRQTSEPAKESPDENAELKKQVAELIKQNQQREFNEEIGNAVRAVKGDLEISDKHVRAMVIGRVSDDPRAMQAYMERQENPSRWNKVLTALHNEMVKDFGGKAETTGDDVESVEALVRNNTAPPAQEKDMGKFVEKAAEYVNSGNFAAYNKLVQDL